MQGNAAQWPEGRDVSTQQIHSKPLRALKIQRCSQSAQGLEIKQMYVTVCKPSKVTRCKRGVVPTEEGERSLNEAVRRVGKAKPWRIRKDFSGGSKWVEMKEEHEQNLRQVVITRAGKISYHIQYSQNEKWESHCSWSSQSLEVLSWKQDWSSNWVSKKAHKVTLILSLCS